MNVGLSSFNSTHLGHPCECRAELKFVILMLQVLALEQGCLAPSSCTWSILVRGTKVLPLAEFLTDVQRVCEAYVPLTVDSFRDIAGPVIKQIINNSFPENEGFPQALISPVVAQIVQILNDRSSDTQYKFSILPVIKEEPDRRCNKRSDTSIYRIYSKRTYVVIECKLGISAQLSATLLDHLSQLFLESFNVYQTEGCKHPQILCILTDCHVWHVFLMNFERSLWTPMNYIVIQNAAGQDTLRIKRITEVIIDYVPNRLTY